MIGNKRYKDIFEQYIYKEEKTPFTLGTLVVCGFCILLLIIATFTQISIPCPVLQYNADSGLGFITKSVNYTPRIPIMLFIIYLLGRNFSIFVFVLYLLIGFFVWPIFVFGSGVSYLQNYLFGYFLGFIFAIFISGGILKITQNIKAKFFASLFGVLSIHIVGIVYAIILAIFKIIDFGIIIPIAYKITGSKILFDLFFSMILLFVGPYIKNVFWICMKPKPDRKKIAINRANLE